MSSPAASQQPPLSGAGRDAVHGEDGTSRRPVHEEVPVRIGSGGTDLSQVEADTELMLRVSVEGFDGLAWRQLVEHVYDYARRTLHQFLVQGMLVHRVRRALPNDPDAQKSVSAFLSATEEQHRELRDEVINEAVARALSYWRRRVIPEGRWNPAEGAQLRTYFVNVALMRLVKVIQPHLQRLQRTPRHDVEQVIDQAMQVHQVTGPRSPFEQVEAAHDAAARLARLHLEPLEKRIFEMKAADLTHDEIADRLGLSSGKAVESRVARCRRRLRAS